MILHLAETGSTSDWLRDNAPGLPDEQWVRADRQTAARGRLQRPWASPPGNLAASCLIRLQPGEERAAELGFVAAVALHDCVVALVDTGRVRLKWPNDLMLDGAKLSGILLERSGGEVVMGIGVNLAHAPEVPGRTTASLDGLIGPAPFCTMLAAAFSRRRQQWRNNGFAAIRLLWLAAAHPPGTPLKVTIGGVVVAGVFAGLADDGALLLQVPSAGVQVIHAGDVWEG